MKYLLLLLFVSCAPTIDTSKLQTSAKHLEYSMNELNCVMNLDKYIAKEAIAKYNFTNKEQVSFYIDHLVLKCVEKTYGVEE